MNTLINRETKVIDLGLVDYQEAWDYQTTLFNGILAMKANNRTSDNGHQLLTSNFILLCEHPHVFTLGKSGDERNLLVKKEDLPSIDATYYHTNRGGDITYHGPGQLVVYPVIDLENFFTDIHQYMRSLEKAVIMTLLEWRITGERKPGLTGVWIKEKKICALGVKMSRWVTMHGLALNVHPDLRYFNHIIPCGIGDKEVTSMELELGETMSMEGVKKSLVESILKEFDMTRTAPENPLSGNGGTPGSKGANMRSTNTERRT